VVHLLKMWLKVPVEERDEKGNRRLTGGGKNTCGTPQGGVVSPMLANLYMNRFLKYWRMSGQKERFQAHVVNYADDFVILSRGKAEPSLNWTRGVMTKLKLTLNEAKRASRQRAKKASPFSVTRLGRITIGRMATGTSAPARRRKVWQDSEQKWEIS
jgi:RNA-directed DNA polymerase